MKSIPQMLNDLADKIEGFSAAYCMGPDLAESDQHVALIRDAARHIHELELRLIEARKS